jgi:hypothetical protein
MDKFPPLMNQLQVPTCIAIELGGGLFTLTATDWVTGGQCIIIL